MKNKLSKKLPLIAVLMFVNSLINSINMSAQKIYSVDHEYQADVKVFVVDAEYKADLVVYRTDKEYRAKKEENKGIWFITDRAYCKNRR